MYIDMIISVYIHILYTPLKWEQLHLYPLVLLEDLVDE